MYEVVHRAIHILRLGNDFFFLWQHRQMLAEQYFYKFCSLNNKFCNIKSSNILFIMFINIWSLLKPDRNIYSIKFIEDVNAFQKSKAHNSHSTDLTWTHWWSSTQILQLSESEALWNGRFYIYHSLNQIWNIKLHDKILMLPMSRNMTVNTLTRWVAELFGDNDKVGQWICYHVVLSDRIMLTER